MDFGTAMDPKDYNLPLSSQSSYGHRVIDPHQLYVQSGTQQRQRYQDADVMSRYHGKLLAPSRKKQTHCPSNYNHNHREYRSIRIDHSAPRVPARSMSVCAEPNQSNVPLYSNQRNPFRPVHVHSAKYDGNHTERDHGHRSVPPLGHHEVHVPNASKPPNPQSLPRQQTQEMSPYLQSQGPQQSDGSHHGQYRPSPPHYQPPCAPNMESGVNPEYDYSDSEEDNQSYFARNVAVSHNDTEKIGCSSRSKQWNEIQSVTSSHYRNMMNAQSVHSGNCSSSATPPPTLSAMNLSHRDADSKEPGDEEKRREHCDAMTHSTFIDDQLSCYLPGASKSRNKARARDRVEQQRELREQQEQNQKANSTRSSPGHLRIEVVNQKDATTNRSDSGLQEERRDYRCFVIPSVGSYGKYSVIMDVDYCRVEKQFQIVDHDGKVQWVDIPSPVLNVDAEDMFEKNAKEMSESLRIRGLTLVQIGNLFAAFRRRLSARPNCIV